MHNLHTLQRRRLLELPLNLPPLIILATLAMQSQQRTKIELRGLQQLDLPNMHVLQRIDALRALLDLSSNDLGDQLARQLRECHAGRLPLDDLRHLLPDRANLRAGCVGGLLDLVGPALGEGDGEQSEEVVVCCLDCDVCFDECLPLAHEGS